jgi:hypothetical protein
MSSTWMWVLIFLACGLMLNLWQNRSNKKAHLDAVKRQIERLQERIDTARTFYLEALQRELANIIMSEDLEAFEKAFHWMVDWQYEIDKSRERRLAEYNLLLEKFPGLGDFDLVGTKHFIRYQDRPMWGMDELVERYKEVSQFLIVDPSKTSLTRFTYNEHEVEIFRERIQTYKDLRLKQAIQEGMKRYRMWRNDHQPQDNESFQDSEYEVLSLLGLPNREFTPEVEWGVFCKALSEYGLYTYFGHDDKNYYSYYRSDSTFSAKNVLRS